MDSGIESQLRRYWDRPAREQAELARFGAALHPPLQLQPGLPRAAALDALCEHLEREQIAVVFDAASGRWKQRTNVVGLHSAGPAPAQVSHPLPGSHQEEPS